MNTLPDNFDLSLIGDEPKLPEQMLVAFRELAWRKAKANPAWWLENFWEVEVPGKGYVPFVLRDYQHEDVLVFEEACRMEMAREVRLKARQIGMSTLTLALAFHNAYFNDYHSWLAALQTEDDAKGALNKMMWTPFSRLPQWVRDRGPELEKKNSEEIAFKNGSTLLVVPATEGAGRSKAVFGVILDENAFAEYAAGLYAAMDPLCYGPMFVFSTANGIGNHFHDTWVGAQSPHSPWNEAARKTLPNVPWNGTFRPWHVVPGRDAKWYDRKLRSYKSSKKEHLFYQEFPADPEEAFIKSGRTALPVEHMRNTQPIGPPKWKINLDFLSIVEDVPLDQLPRMPGDQVRDIDDPWDHELWVWEMPTVERDDEGRPLRPPNYAIAADVAEGLEHGDRTSIVIGDANNRDVVATYRGHWPVEDLSTLLDYLGYAFHEALLGPERNNFGIMPIKELQQMEYPRMLRAKSYARRRTQRDERYGWITTKASKPLMVTTFVKYLMAENITVHDPRLIEEAMTFVSDGRGGFGASGENYDDHIMAHLILVMMMDDIGEYAITWKDQEDHPLTYGELYAALDRFSAGSSLGGLNNLIQGQVKTGRVFAVRGGGHRRA